MGANGGVDTSATDLRLDRLTKRFDDHVAVRDMSLQAYSGEFISFLGPSGCGKTTTLSMIAGFQTASAGEIYIRSRRVDRLPPERRNAGMVFQDYALFPHMSVAENVGFGLRMRRLGKGEIRARVAEALATVRMSSFAERRPTQLSGGQKQRVALARALVIKPDVLLLDEPFGALDRQLREQMQYELKLLQREVGITTIFVTHDQEEALLLSSRIAVMHEGAIEQLGTPAEIYSTPETIFVAQFIGKSNFIDGKIVSLANNSVTLDMPIGRIPISLDSSGIGVGDCVSCMVRPEQVRIVGGEPGLKDDVRATARIDQIGYHGSSSQILLRLPGGSQFTSFQSQRDMARLIDTAIVGGSVEIAWPKAAMTPFIKGRRCR